MKMKIEFNTGGDHLELYVGIGRNFLGVTVDNNDSLCVNNNYNGDHAYFEIADKEEFVKFVEFCKNVVKEWELRNK